MPGPARVAAPSKPNMRQLHAFGASTRVAVVETVAASYTWFVALAPFAGTTLALPVKDMAYAPARAGPPAPAGGGSLAAAPLRRLP